MRQRWRKAILLILLVLASGGVGAVAGIYYSETMRHAEAYHLWMQGAAEFEQHRYETALSCYIQALALKSDEAVFFLSIAEAYEAKKDDTAAVHFYRLALERYGEGRGPAKRIRDKIELLEARKRGE